MNWFDILAISRPIGKPNSGFELNKKWVEDYLPPSNKPVLIFKY
ncbi:hypothetical protein P872_03665 [Rhodonellum psychrophilum GCM71 = DSM 17998]|uniref:Uncharacterized protein n=1 Tax=Rhodonellum psychrophilum GCM71 = DSM 17998 TaxID=1123057 RepID=U5BSB5_9BACT|nr:hypothetical protein P872_03665 [Rhodonellum psychrophilum GCM71 = DSM 17998]